MIIRPITLRGARAFVAQHHRHNAAPQGWLFGVAAVVNEEIVGVGIAGRPTGRGLDDGRTIEVVRCCTDGTPNACSLIYGALCRAAKALGYETAVTYTLASEPGSSLRAAGFIRDADLPPRSYGGGRARYDENLFGELVRPVDAKVRWRRVLHLAASSSPALAPSGGQR